MTGQEKSQIIRFAASRGYRALKEQLVGGIPKFNPSEQSIDMQQQAMIRSWTSGVMHVFDNIDTLVSEAVSGADTPNYEQLNHGE
jgi:hypothetical protein